MKWLVLGVLGLVVLGAVYQQIGTALDARLAPPPSEMANVDGREVHIVCMGKGPRTFVLDAGAGAGAFEWWRIQPLLAKSGRVCAYDRSGSGWSDPSGGNHDAATLAAELKALVRSSGISTPFIYVGHSLGANIAMVYREKFPRDVAGLVLIEPGNPKDLLEDFRGTREEAMRASDCGIACHAAGAVAYVGIARLGVLIAKPGAKNLSGPALREYRAVIVRPAHIMATMASYADALPKTAYEDMDVRSFGDTPVIVFASSEHFSGDGFDSISDYEKWRKEQHAYFALLAAKSTRGNGPVIIAHSNHTSMVMGESPSATLVQEINRFVADAAL